MDGDEEGEEKTVSPNGPHVKVEQCCIRPASASHVVSFRHPFGAHAIVAHLELPDIPKMHQNTRVIIRCRPAQIAHLQRSSK